MWLFFADLVHGFAEFVSLKWLSDGSVHSGTLCTFQGIYFIHQRLSSAFQIISGVLITISANSIAMSTAVRHPFDVCYLFANFLYTSFQAITIHTSWILCFKKGSESGQLAINVVGVALLYIILFNVILYGTHKDDAILFAPNPVSKVFHFGPNSTQRYIL
jgi:hypothetical protein